MHNTLDGARGGKKIDSALTVALTQLGMLSVPVGVIALFCQVLNVSPRNTGAISIGTLALTAICLYRRQINRHVPSALLTGLVVLLAGVFFFNYENILLKNTGLIRYYRHSNDFLSSIDPEIRAAKSEIWFFGTNFNISAGERRQVILERLGAGARVRFLIFSPRDSSIDTLAKDFSQSPAELRAECEKGLQSILVLISEWTNRNRRSPGSGELLVKVFDAHPHARFYAFDPDDRGGHSYFVPYVNETNSPEAPGFLLANTETGVFRAYFDGLKRLWNASQTLDSYLDAHLSPLP